VLCHDCVPVIDQGGSAVWMERIPLDGVVSGASRCSIFVCLLGCVLSHSLQRLGVCASCDNCLLLRTTERGLAPCIQLLRLAVAAVWTSRYRTSKAVQAVACLHRTVCMGMRLDLFFTAL
jgi:hypothetical protein